MATARAGKHLLILIPEVMFVKMFLFWRGKGIRLVSGFKVSGFKVAGFWFQGCWLLVSGCWLLISSF